jgi:hypothetical protein
MAPDEERIFMDLLRKDEEARKEEHKKTSKKLVENDEYEQITVYGPKE